MGTFIFYVACGVAAYFVCRKAGVRPWLAALLGLLGLAGLLGALVALYVAWRRGVLNQARAEEPVLRNEPPPNQ